MKSGLIGFALLASAVAQAVPYRTAQTPVARELGRMRDVSPSEQITVTVSLKLRNDAQLEDLLSSVYDHRSAQFHAFFSPEQFHARFAPDARTVQRVTAELVRQGLSVEATKGSLLHVTGPADAIERAFGVELHTFEVSGRPGASGYRFHSPVAAPKLSESMAPWVEAVAGLDSRPRFRPHVHRVPANRTPQSAPASSGAPNTPDAPGSWTVLDFADYYHVNPLYRHQVLGKGRTIGIVTLAAFTPSDAFAYWSGLGLTTNANRIKIVNIDNGPGAPSDASGSDETTLDVEQSGGIAPEAKIVVYQAPNTDQGFLDAFASAVDEDAADAVSCSWGEWEELIDPTELQAFHNVFRQAALQGQSLSVASGDNGAYDGNGSFPLPQFTQILSVDHPASDPWVVAAGGTTLPGKQQFLLPSGQTFTVDVPHERAWGWEYLDGLCATLGLDPISCGIFPVGDGGGVSVLFHVPLYQDGLSGIHRSAPNQSLVDTSQTPPLTIITLPEHFHGRNVPDVSLNADPDTGYILVYTSDQSGFGVSAFNGGTSFVAPQLAGVTALLDQAAGGRVGLLNFPLYELAQSGFAYGFPGAPLRDIVHGNNEHYKAVEGYDPATGLGSLDVANLAELLGR